MDSEASHTIPNSVVHAMLVAKNDEQRLVAENSLLRFMLSKLGVDTGEDFQRELEKRSAQ